MRGFAALLTFAFAICCSSPAFAWVRFDEQDVEIGFSVKLFASSVGEEAISVAQGVPEFPFNVEISSLGGPLKCAAGSLAPGANSAREKIKNKALVEAEAFQAVIQGGEEFVCASTQDRKINVVYRIKKNIAENAYGIQIKQALDELKKGSPTSEFAVAVLKSILDKNFNTLQIKAGRAEVIVLKTPVKVGVPMITLMTVEPMTLSGTKIEPSGKSNSTHKNNIYPKHNRFALICGFANAEDGVIAQPFVPKGEQKVTVWSSTSNGKALGCIVNNSPDGFDSIDPYVEDPFYKINYIALPQTDFEAGLEKLRFEITEAVDRERASRLEQFANNLLAANKKRVQEEMTRRRTEALKSAGYPVEATVDLIPLQYNYSLLGKPRYVPGTGSRAGAIVTDTLFDIQAEKVKYEFKWLDGSLINVTENASWADLSAPLVTKDYSVKYSHYFQEFNVCANQLQNLKDFFKSVERTPDHYTIEELFKVLGQKTEKCLSAGEKQPRKLKYVRYEGACFVETAYSKADDQKQLIRYKPTRIQLVYMDEQKHIHAKLPIDMNRMQASQNLFSGLDVLTTLPFDEARAKTYQVNCDGKSNFPIKWFTQEQIQNQMEVPGFSNLIEGLSNEGTVVKKKVDPNAGKIIL